MVDIFGIISLISVLLPEINRVKKVLNLLVFILLFINFLILLIMDKKQIIADLIKNGAVLIKDLTVKNVTVTVLENYTRLGISIDQEVNGFVPQDDGTFEEGKTNVIFLSAFSVASILKDNDDAAFAANHLLLNPESLSIVLSRAKIAIVQQRVAANEEYVNPWSADAEPTTWDHDVIINHLVDIKMSEFALKRLDKLADHMMGF